MRALVNQADLFLDQETYELKEQLRRSPSQAAVVALERLWRPVQAVTDLRQIRGEWHLRNPKDSTVRGWTSGDLPRILLDLYAGDFGRMLSMELVSPPVLTITGAGDTETRSQLRWGSQRDEVVLHGALTLVAPNHLREAPKSVRSSALKMTLPSMQKSRDMRVTYHDGELLIIRDDRGIVDVLWRWQQGSLPAAAPPRSSVRVEPAAAPPQAAEPAGPEAAPTTQVERLLNEVEVLKATLEAQRARATEDRAQRRALTAELARLEKAVQSAQVESLADTVKLNALARMQGEGSEAAQSQRERSEDKARLQQQLSDEVQTLRERASELEQQVGRLHAQETSLRGQITVLESEQNTGDREARSAYRVAVAKAKAELGQIRTELRDTEREVASLQRELGQKTAQLRRKMEEVEAEVAKNRMLEAQLEAQRHEFSEQQGRLSEKVTTEQGLRAELEQLQRQLRELQEREARGLELASSVEREMKEIVTQANKAQEVAKSLNSKGRRFWPWR